ncbi:MAG TPA: hypothetical protein VND93_08520, partial [Myxococcales bacterium]|nr:hypothetical protein [Myxococcales bacterium]
GNTAYQLQTSTGSTPTPQAVFSLPANFDWYTGDGFQTPFANGNAVDFVVIPYDVIGNAVDPSTATAIRRNDNTAPRITSAIQNGNADNTSGGAPITITLAVAYDEYMQYPGPTPTISLNGGATATYTPDPNLLGGTFTITIPAGANGSGSFSIYGPNDSSGNPLTQYDGLLRAQTQLVVDPGFESGALTSWAPTTTSTASAPALVTSPVYSGTYAVRLGNSTYGTGTPTVQGGQSQITQLMNVPAGTTTVTASVRYITYTNYSFSGHDSLSCYLYSGTGSFIGTIFTDYLDDPTNWKLGTATFTVSGVTQIRIYCYSYQDSFHISGGYIDEVRILAN